MTECLLIEYSLSFQVLPMQKKFVRQQAFKKSTVSTDHVQTVASNIKAAGNSLFGTVDHVTILYFLPVFFICEFSEEKNVGFEG